LLYNVHLLEYARFKCYEVQKMYHWMLQGSAAQALEHMYCLRASYDLVTDFLILPMVTNIQFTNLILSRPHLPRKTKVTEVEGESHRGQTSLL